MTRTPRTNAQRPGLDDNWRAVWTVTYYEAAEDGTGHQPNGRCWTTELDAHPLTSDRTISHQDWLYINREQPDIPEVDLYSAHVQLQGYAAGIPDENGNLPRLHGVRCAECGSPKMVFTAGPWANCQACGKRQTQGEATLCSSHCEDCSSQETERPGEPHPRAP